MKFCPKPTQDEHRTMALVIFLHAVQQKKEYKFYCPESLQHGCASFGIKIGFHNSFLILFATCSFYNITIFHLKSRQKAAFLKTET